VKYRVKGASIVRFAGRISALFTNLTAIKFAERKVNPLHSETMLFSAIPWENYVAIQCIDSLPNTSPRQQCFVDLNLTRESPPDRGPC
jgi:hypothetical protein